MKSMTASSGPSADLLNKFYINGKCVAEAYSWIATNGCQDTDNNAFSIFLKQGDKIYFSMIAYVNAAGREGKAYCYPMF